MTALKSLLFLVCVPGVVAGAVPLGFLASDPCLETGRLSWLAVPFWSMGIVILLWSFRDFLTRGRGTPAPMDPPKELVVDGMYRHVRNPMYIGVLMILAGHFLWFGCWSQLAYAGFIFTAFHIFVLLYEERHLRNAFGKTYEEYVQRVPRWIPRIN